MDLSESSLLLILCGDFPSSLGLGPAVTGRQWEQLCRALAAAECSFSDLQSPEKLPLPLGDTLRQRILLRLSRCETIRTEAERLRRHGVCILTRADPDYPDRLREHLHLQAPAVLYAAGGSVPSAQAVGVVGSRDADPDALRFASRLAAVCAAEHTTVVSGGAAGVDTAAEEAATEHGGYAVVCCADGLLSRFARRSEEQPERAQHTRWLSAAHPEAAFVSYRALERNRIIYCLSDYAVAVSADAQRGGTWSGATDNLRHGWCPLFVRSDGRIRDGNRLLLSRADVAGLSLSDLADRSLPLTDRLRERHPLTQHEQLQWF